MKEILPGLFQLVLPLPGFSPDSMNVYLFRGSGRDGGRNGDGYTIIDTGWDTEALVKSVQDQLAEYSISFSEIKQVLITHCHVDHLGMIGRYKKENGARICYHQNEVDLIKIRFTGGDHYWPMTEQFLQTNGMPAAELTPTRFQLPSVTSIPAADVFLKGGEVISLGDYNLKAVNTPGHTPGHTAYYEPGKKLLFGGDVLLPTIVTNAALHVQHSLNPIRQYLDSLRELYKLEVELVLPGHEYIFRDHRRRIDDLIKHNLKKNRDIYNTFHDSLPKSAYQVSQLLAWSPETGDTSWSRLSDWDKRFAVLQTIAHLEELAYTGKLTKLTKEQKVLYYRPDK
jgi:glyoxylase-like metal-dependent hydrolase (beta-lactamase superfamily II)